MGKKVNTLYTEDGHEVLYFSKSFIDTLEQKWKHKGYSIRTSKAQFILLWKDSQEDKEYRIVLPSLRLRKT